MTRVDVRFVIQEEQTSEALWIHEEERDVQDGDVVTLFVPGRTTAEGLLIPVTVTAA